MQASTIISKVYGLFDLKAHCKISYLAACQYNTYFLNKKVAVIQRLFKFEYENQRNNIGQKQIEADIFLKIRIFIGYYERNGNAFIILS